MGDAISEHVEFFVAPDDPTAADILNTGPKIKFTTVSGTFFDADDAVLTWEHLLAGQTGDNVITRDEPRIVAPWVNDGSAVFALSDQLTACLAQAEPHRLREIADEWSADMRANGDEIGVDAALDILTGVVRLAGEAIRLEHCVYCWVSG